MPERSADWIRQAERDLESAKAQRRDGFFEWSCFIAQQAAEKALKAVIQRLGGEAWGHSTSGLLAVLTEKVDIPVGLDEGARFLDMYYITSRYPNGWASGIPAKYIREDDAEKAIGCSEELVRFCRGLLAR